MGGDWRQQGSLAWCGLGSDRHDVGHSLLIVLTVLLLIESEDPGQETCALETAETTIHMDSVMSYMCACACLQLFLFIHKLFGTTYSNRNGVVCATSTLVRYPLYCTVESCSYGISSHHRRVHFLWKKGGSQILH